MQILLANDDGIYAPGLAALEHELKKLGDVFVVAPATEQSGVGHSITFLTPLTCHEVYVDDRRRGWAVQGSPADCVKLGVSELCPVRPDLIVSGINGGLNAGINVLYSGTVAAAIEGAFFGIDSIAVSLEYDDNPNFAPVAERTRKIINQILKYKDAEPRLYNLNFPTAASTNPDAQLKVVPMGVERYGEDFVKRTDPKGRAYYWATSDPPPKPGKTETDLTALAAGHITLTPLDYDMTRPKELEKMLDWDLH